MAKGRGATSKTDDRDDFCIFRGDVPPPGSEADGEIDTTPIVFGLDPDPPHAAVAIEDFAKGDGGETHVALLLPAVQAAREAARDEDPGFEATDFTFDWF